MANVHRTRRTAAGFARWQPMRTLLIVAVMVVAAGAEGAQAQELRAYSEPRFGTTAQVPAGWQSQPITGALGSGHQFVSPDGQTWVAVYGREAEPTAAEEQKRDEGLARDERVTYRAGGERWFVRSGFKEGEQGGERIFYRKAIMSCRGRIAHLLAFEYPAGEKREHDRLVTLMSRSLRAGRGSEGC
jgi:serine/threonine-protein kinase